LGIVMSHHQKMVVIDNKVAFMGGMDFAYGRRDDGNFTLQAKGRTLNELYNPCVPPIHPLSNVEKQNCVTVAELLAAAFTRGGVRDAATFATSPSEGVVAKGMDIGSTVHGQVRDGLGALKDRWDNINIFADLTEMVQDAPVDAAQWASRWAWGKLPAHTQAKLLKLFDAGAGNAASVGSALVAYINGGSLALLPPKLQDATADAVHALLYGVLAGIQAAADYKPEYYERLFKKVTTVPSGGVVRDAAVQPRMPWHDVHCKVQGPGVFDLSKNFTRRWNSVAVLFERSFAKYRDPLATALLKAAGLKLPETPKRHASPRPTWPC
jgi:phospholipase D1/2